MQYRGVILKRMAPFFWKSALSRAFLAARSCGGKGKKPLCRWQNDLDPKAILGPVFFQNDTIIPENFR